MSDKEKSPKTGKQEQALKSLVIGGATYTTRLTYKFRNRKAWQRPDERKVEAFIPGTIQRIFAKEGQEVKAGTPLLILEAMKMRNEVLAPLNGVIKKIHVSEGEMVPKSHLLIELV